MKGRILVAVIMLLVVSLIAIGCRTGVSQQDYDKVKTDLAQVQQELSTTKTELSASQADLSGVQASLSTAQTELTSLKSKYPPHDFATVTALQQWVSSHLLPPIISTTTAEDLFRGALSVQEAALADGYSMSVNIQYYSDTDLYRVAGNAMVAGQCYAVDFWTGQVVPWTGFVR